MPDLRNTQVVTGEVRISYEHLLKPYANPNTPGAEPKYSCTILIPKSDTATKQRIDMAINAAITDGVSAKWNGAKPAQPPTPLYDGDGLRPSGEAFGEECKGHWVMTASSKLQPEVVDTNGNPIFSPSEIYSGMYARVFINFFAYNAAGRKGIGAGLGPVQKLRDGEPLGGRVSASDVFGGGAPAYPQQAQPQAQYQAQPQPQYQAQPQYQPQQQQQFQPQPQPQQAYASAIDPLTGLPIN